CASGSSCTYGNNHCSTFDFW
nr:immunoglobulin heavy chain junction region [Macaca mulatta]MOW22458.1 immunoglobulin heavy chain junction region [Macaca mulatta]